MRSLLLLGISLIALSDSKTWSPWVRLADVGKSTRPPAPTFQPLVLHRRVNSHQGYLFQQAGGGSPRRTGSNPSSFPYGYAPEVRKGVVYPPVPVKTPNNNGGGVFGTNPRRTNGQQSNYPSGLTEINPKNGQHGVNNRRKNGQNTPGYRGGLTPINPNHNNGQNPGYHRSNNGINSQPTWRQSPGHQNRQNPGLSNRNEVTNRRTWGPWVLTGQNQAQNGQQQPHQSIKSPSPWAQKSHQNGKSTSWTGGNKQPNLQQQPIKIEGQHQQPIKTEHVPLKLLPPPGANTNAAKPQKALRQKPQNARNASTKHRVDFLGFAILLLSFTVRNWW